eukprot:gene2742-1727_t
MVFMVCEVCFRFIDYWDAIPHGFVAFVTSLVYFVDLMARVVLCDACFVFLVNVMCHLLLFVVYMLLDLLTLNVVYLFMLVIFHHI